MWKSKTGSHRLTGLLLAELLCLGGTSTVLPRTSAAQIPGQTRVRSAGARSSMMKVSKIAMHPDVLLASFVSAGGLGSDHSVFSQGPALLLYFAF